MKNNIQHIFFDLDHTLWDFDKNSALTFEKIFKHNDIQIDLRAFLDHYEPINLELWKLYREDKINKIYLRYNRLKRTFNRLDMEVDDDTINQLSKDYITHLSSFDFLMQDAINVLNYLSDNYQLHIITNGFRSVQEKKLNTSKIAHYFKTVTTSDCTGVKKPNPIVFEHALHKAKAVPENSVMIGDSIEADVEGAQKLGITAIWCNFKQEENINSYNEIRQLNELNKMF